MPALSRRQQEDFIHCFSLASSGRICLSLLFFIAIVPRVCALCDLSVGCLPTTGCPPTATPSPTFFPLYCNNSLPVADATIDYDNSSAQGFRGWSYGWRINTSSVFTEFNTTIGYYPPCT